MGNAARNRRFTKKRLAVEASGLFASVMKNVFILIFTLLTLLAPLRAEMPKLFLIGDSTVKNGDKGMMGWGTKLPDFFDTEKLKIENRALGGRSSRTYRTEGLWAKVLAEIKPGDYVMMQFGHNDNGPMDSGKARASIKGNGDQSKEIIHKETGKKETVYSYGWYLRQYAAEAQEKGAKVIICSPVPRNIWKEGKVVRSTKDYCSWATEAAAQAKAGYMDLNDLLAAQFEAAGNATTQTYFTPKDHTHFSEAGAQLAAETIAKTLRERKELGLAEFLKQ
jgi:lysophospholipase L1-like esterase